MLLFGKSNEKDQPQTVTLKKRRNPYPDAEVISLSPTTLMAKNRFVCEVCYKGFPRDQNLQLHKRGHNLPWKLKQKSTTDEVKRKVYLCPESSCINHEASHALGDLTGIKKHYFRKHGEKKYKCQKCEKMYAVKSDLKAHLKTCGTKEYQCHCGTIFSRRDSFINHRAFCDALTEGIPTKTPMGVNSFKSNGNHNYPNHMNINLPHLGFQVPSTQNLSGNNLEIAQGGQKSYNNMMIKTSMDLKYYKSPTTSFGPSSDEQNQHKYQGNFDTCFFTNLLNNITSPHKNMQLYNLNFRGNPINNTTTGDGSSLFSGGSIVSHHSASLYLSSHTPQFSATGLLHKAFLLGSTSSTNTTTNLSREHASSSSSGVVGGTMSENVKSLFSYRHFGNSGSNDHHSDMNELLNSFSNGGVGASIFNQYTGDHNDSSQGGLDSGIMDYDGEWKMFNSVEQNSPQNSIGFKQLSGVKTTRDFLGVGVGNISSDEPKSTFAGRSFL